MLIAYTDVLVLENVKCDAELCATGACIGIFDDIPTMLFSYISYDEVKKGGQRFPSLP